MGWGDFWSDVEDDVKGEFSNIDQKLNLSDNKNTWMAVGTFGISDGGLTAGLTYTNDQAEEAKDKANAAAEAVNQSRLSAQRTQNFRSFYNMASSTQQSAADLMAIAAAGGFSGSSAVTNSMSSARSQVGAMDNYFSTLDKFGMAEASAMSSMRSEEQRMQKYNMYFQTGLNIATSVGLKAFGV